MANSPTYRYEYRAPLPVPSPPSHGTVEAFQNGCRCGSCTGMAVATAKAMGPPAATVRPATPRRRAGRGWTVRVEPVGDLVASPAANGGMQDLVLLADLVICWWTGVTGILVTSEDTWRLIEQDDGAITAMTEAQEEAKQRMPSAVVRDVALAAQLTVKRDPVDPRKPPKSKHGIEELGAQLRQLVEDMAKFPHPTVPQQTEFARRYGAYRDRMAVIRREFTAVEGTFEAAQMRLMAFMQDDE